MSNQGLLQDPSFQRGHSEVCVCGHVCVCIYIMCRSVSVCVHKDIRVFMYERVEVKVCWHTLI